MGRCFSIKLIKLKNSVNLKCSQLLVFNLDHLSIFRAVIL
uniref:Uncharacterized protein n=1 Tax=Arundo donax TaxID=35708 RepID=A0A0A9DVK7_ARUDO